MDRVEREGVKKLTTKADVRLWHRGGRANERREDSDRDNMSRHKTCREFLQCRLTMDAMSDTIFKLDAFSNSRLELHISTDGSSTSVCGIWMGQTDIHATTPERENLCHSWLLYLRRVNHPEDTLGCAAPSPACYQC